MLEKFENILTKFENGKIIFHIFDMFFPKHSINTTLQKVCPVYRALSLPFFGCLLTPLTAISSDIIHGKQTVSLPVRREENYHCTPNSIFEFFPSRQKKFLSHSHSSLTLGIESLSAGK